MAGKKKKSQPKTMTPYDRPSVPRKSARQANRHVQEPVPLPSEPTTTRVTSRPRIPSASATVSSDAPEHPTRREFEDLKDNVSLILQSIQDLKNNTSVPSHSNNISSLDSQNTAVNVEVNDLAFHALPQNSVGDNTRFRNNVTVGGNTPALDIIHCDVQEAVNVELDDMFNSGEPKHLDLPGRPVDHKISLKLKQQIWADEYIDLGLLLDPTIDHQPNTFNVVSRTGETLAVAPNKNSKVITSLGQWCTAFNVYITIYCQKHPAQLGNLMTYLATVKSLCHRNGDYITYDREFRYLRQSCKLNWAVIHSGIWLECRDSANAKSTSTKSSNMNNNPKPPSNFRHSNSNSKSNHPNGYCFKYHDTGKCPKGPNCNYSHNCYNAGCTTKHPIFKCFKLLKADNTQVTQGNSNPKPNNNNTVANSNKRPTA